MSFGCCISCIAVIFFGSAFTPSLVSMCPIYDSSFVSIPDLSLFSLRFNSRVLCSTFSNLVLGSPIVLPHTKISSTMTGTPSISSSACVIRLWNTSGAELIPNGSLRYLYRYKWGVESYQLRTFRIYLDLPKSRRCIDCAEERRSI